MTISSSSRCALLSVSDKTGIADFARALAQDHGYQILSTGGTASLLREEGIAVTDVSDYTGFPEMMAGRIKTLHPGVHGGILARREVEEDRRAMAEHNIAPIDIVAVNLYPFEATIARNASYDEVIENIDIGGPAMVRAAAKNHAHVSIIVDPTDYDDVLASCTDDSNIDAMRKRLSAKAFARTAQYDAIISGWFARELGDTTPDIFTLPMQKLSDLRYGENPHQQAAFYSAERGPIGSITDAQQLHGKALSFNNINDTHAAWSLVCEFAAPAIAIIKHANPCGVAIADNLSAAYDAAFACDKQSAFGGIIAANKDIDADTARAIALQFAEVVIAPGFSAEALSILQAKKNIRLLTTNGALLDAESATYDVRSVSGGYLVQTSDNCIWQNELTHVAQREPEAAEVDDMKLAFTIAKHVKSNAIVLVKDGATIGIGAGQMSRVDSVRVACQKAAAAGLTTQGSAMASDAFFPFDDNIHQAAKAGIRAVIQPGGSIRDNEVIAAANEHDMALSVTGIRHFRH